MSALTLLFPIYLLFLFMIKQVVQPIYYLIVVDYLNINTSTLFTNQCQVHLVIFPTFLQIYCIQNQILQEITTGESIPGYITVNYYFYSILQILSYRPNFLDSSKNEDDCIKAIVTLFFHRRSVLYFEEPSNISLSLHCLIPKRYQLHILA